MKAAVLHKVHGPLSIEDFEMPAISPDEVLIKVKACGVCHTDHKVIEGRIQSRMPAVIGHEVSGTIEEVGSSQRGAFEAGDAVIVGTRYRCGHCQYCFSGRENLCRARPAPASLKRTDGQEIYRWNVGGFSQYLALPGYMVFKLPGGLSLDEASVVGCRMTTAYNAVKNSAEIKPGDSALVIGCGGVGLNTIQFLRTFGAYPIIAVDVLDDNGARVQRRQLRGQSVAAVAQAGQHLGLDVDRARRQQNTSRHPRTRVLRLGKTRVCPSGNCAHGVRRLRHDAKDAARHQRKGRDAASAKPVSLKLEVS